MLKDASSNSCQALPLPLVVRVVAHQAAVDTVPLQQPFGVPRVLGQDCVGGAQNTQRAQRDVLQVPNRGPNKVQPWRQQRVFAIAGSLPVFGRRAVSGHLPRRRRSSVVQGTLRAEL